MVHVLGVIPARGGSKGIPNKNLALLAGKPLLAHTCEQARAAKSLTRVILSTDDEAIAQRAKAWGVEVPFIRPVALATDNAPMLEVLLHSIEVMQRQENYKADLVVLLQPTSPLRRAELIDCAVKEMLAAGVDSVVSVVEVPHQFSLASLLKIQDGYLVPCLDRPQILRRQDKPKVFARNGPAILVTRREVLEQGQLYGSKTKPLVMLPEESIDIDNNFDLFLAECILARRIKLEA